MGGAEKHLGRRMAERCDFCTGHFAQSFASHCGLERIVDFADLFEREASWAVDDSVFCVPVFEDKDEQCAVGAKCGDNRVPDSYSGVPHGDCGRHEFCHSTEGFRRFLDEIAEGFFVASCGFECALLFGAGTVEEEEVIDKVTVALVAGDSTGGSVRLIEKTEVGDFGHFITDGGTADAEIVLIGDKFA